MRNEKKKKRIAILFAFAAAFLILLIVFVGFAVFGIVHALQNPSWTTTENLIWFFSSKWRLGCVIGLIVSYAGVGIFGIKADEY